MKAAARAYDPAGAGRHLAASRAAPNRRSALTALTCPTLVIHGVDDPLVPIAGGQDIASSVPGAWFLAISGMGHDLPPQLVDLSVSAIGANARRSSLGQRAAFFRDG